MARDLRRVRNEKLFRNLNERLKELDDKLDTGVVGAPPSEREEFFCECGRLDCMARFEMTRADYEAVRAHGARFAVLEEHVDEAIERIVDTHPNFVVVEKLPGAPAEMAQDADPRV
jgi:hypothetical protein